MSCYDESQRARQWTANVRVLPIDGPTTPDDSAAVADRDELERAFRRLPIDQRAVFVLHHYLGLPLVEMTEEDARDPRGHGPIATALRDTWAARRPRGRAGARRSRRTSRMTDDRSLERAARSWIEAARPRPLTAPWRPRSSGSSRPPRSGISASWRFPPCPPPPASPRRRHRCACDRRRLLPALAKQSIQCRALARPFADGIGHQPRASARRSQVRKPRLAAAHGAIVQATTQGDGRLRWPLRRERAHPAVYRLAGRPTHGSAGDCGERPHRRS